nr:AMP-binding protein [Kibdelosporangium sp. MJ126-NF4]CEL15847.1 Aspartyl-tRNA(Asn) amidotransferase subunit A @ Glutamyl-tRNA(Gln) amidotransferase subunit A [Kibdelosporangium sp. MJ126-NF4]CTQ93772.1 Aspartyl-tRNA(Asn) amidotransferase subunit A (EC 6.3.5.6) @ Glutamyl-tRNA(Gln) amidotransferase subunit A (EC 6.3.5.7) [Kibdelosporangium sp. MJ126-NF4]
MSVPWSETSWRTHLPDVPDPLPYVQSLGASTIPLLAKASAARFPDKPALDIDGVEITHGALDAEAATVAGWFAARFPPGTRIVLSGPSSVGFVRCYLGALRAGMVVVLANPAYTASELAHLVADSGAALTLTDFDAMSGDPVEPVGGPDDVAVLAYTSGTTGKPKGVPLTHRNLLTSIRSAMAAWRWSADDVLTHALPLFHQHGLSGVHATLIAGSSARLFSKFSDALVTSMRSATVLFAVPTIYARLVSTPEAFSGLRLCVCGSAPLSTALAERLPRVPLVRYGTTESGLDVSNPVDTPRGDTVGIPLPGVHVRLVDEEIQVRGPQVFAGYWGDVDDPFTPDGWFRTGDLGEIVNGHLVIKGRSKELIITGGMNVYPREVELALEEHPAVEAAAVAGLPDPQWGEQVTAWVVLRGDADLQAHARSLLAPYKVPKQFFEVASLPRNHMGKIDRKRLASPLRRAVELGAFVSVSDAPQGIAVAVKDNIAPDAIVWQRLTEAGCSSIGRTSLPELAYSVLTPGCANPWDRSRHAGGSSGGSAVAVAVGAVRYALGTDTGGSIRIPAALCGVAGLRPTYGVLPMDGIAPLAPSLDTVGPIALTAADCLWMFTAMGGVAAPVPSSLRVGYSLRFCAEDVRAVLESAMAALTEISFTRIEIPDARLAASSLMQSEARALYWAHRDSLSPHLVDILRPSSPVVPFDEWAFPDDLDAILLPVTPIPAAPVGTGGLESMYFRFTALASITGLPALSVPAGLTGGLPVGAQLIGSPGTESILCQLGTMIERTAAGQALASARADLVYQISTPA